MTIYLDIIGHIFHKFSLFSINRKVLDYSPQLEFLQPGDAAGVLHGHLDLDLRVGPGQFEDFVSVSFELLLLKLFGLYQLLLVLAADLEDQQIRKGVIARDIVHFDISVVVF